MDISQLKAFYQVMKSGSFSKAAEELFISQPALSRQVAALEKELGLQLIIRKNRKVTLTDAGRRLMIHAEKIIEISNKAKKEMAELKDLTVGDLTIGASTTIANYILPAIMTIYKKKNPGIILHLKVDNSRNIEKMVNEGKVDIGLVAGKDHADGLYYETFSEDELLIVVSRGYSEKDEDMMDKLKNATFLCRKEGSDTQMLLEELISDMNLEPHGMITLGSTEAIKRGVISGMGVALLSKHTFEYEEKLGLLKPIKNIGIKRPLTICYSRNLKLSPAALSFWTLIKKHSVNS